MKRDYKLSDGEVKTIINALENEANATMDSEEAMRLSNIIAKLRNGGKGFHYANNPTRPNKPLRSAEAVR